MLVGDEVVYTQSHTHTHTHTEVSLLRRTSQRKRESWKGFRVLNLKQHQTERLEAAIAVASSIIVRDSGPRTWVGFLLGTWP